MDIFLLMLFLAGIILASIQDLKKKEVDNWVNFFLLISGASFIIFKAIVYFNFNYILLGSICFIICFILANAFYYGRFFAGGDAKLLIALFPVFVELGVKESLINILVFIAFLMIVGSFYGVVWSLFFYFKDFSKINKQIKLELNNRYVELCFLLGIILFVLSYFKIILLFFSIFILLSCILFAFAKSIEKISMVREIEVSQLREGDWLAKDIIVKGKKIGYNWEGLNKNQLRVIRNYKNKVLIKEGIAFVPAFLIAFLFYLFKNQIFSFIFNLV